MSTSLNDIPVISLIISNKNLIAGTYSGIYISTDNGKTWLQKGVTPSDVKTIYSSGKNLIAGTLLSSVFLSTNQGNDWNQCGLTHKNICGFAKIGNDLYVGAGYGFSQDFSYSPGGVFLSSNDGTSWSEVDNGLTNTRVSAIISKDSNLFVSTNKFQDSTAQIFFSNDNGANWRQTTFSTDLSNISSLAANGSKLFAAASNGNDEYGEVYYSTDYGQNWLQSYIDAYNNINTIFIKDTNIFVGANNGAFLSTDNGTNWQQIGFFYKLEVRSFAESDSIIFAGTSSGVYFSLDNGINWLPANKTLANDNIQSIAVFEKNLFAGTHNGGVWRQPISKILTDVTQNLKESPISYLLYQNFPNPFNPTTTISYSIPKPGLVILKIYDILGREVTTLVNNNKPAGNYEIKFNAGNLSSGVYFYQLKAGNFIATKKLLLLK